MDPAQGQPEVRRASSLPRWAVAMPGGDQRISSPSSPLHADGAQPGLVAPQLPGAVPLENILPHPLLRAVWRGDQGPADSGDKGLAALKDSI